MIIAAQQRKPIPDLRRRVRQPAASRFDDRVAIAAFDEMLPSNELAVCDEPSRIEYPVRRDAGLLKSAFEFLDMPELGSSTQLTVENLCVITARRGCGKAGVAHECFTTEDSAEFPPLLIPLDSNGNPDFLTGTWIAAMRRQEQVAIACSGGTAPIDGAIQQCGREKMEYCLGL